jgi:hypothetical protein
MNGLNVVMVRLILGLNHNLAITTTAIGEVGGGTVDSNPRYIPDACFPLGWNYLLDLGYHN